MAGQSKPGIHIAALREDPRVAFLEDDTEPLIHLLSRALLEEFPKHLGVALADEGPADSAFRRHLPRDVTAVKVHRTAAERADVLKGSWNQSVAWGDQVKHHRLSVVRFNAPNALAQLRRVREHPVTMCRLLARRPGLPLLSDNHRVVI